MSKTTTNITPTAESDDLGDAMKAALSPKAVAAIAAYLQAASTRDECVNREIDWFRRVLVELVGAEYNDLVESVGL